MYVANWKMNMTTQAALTWCNRAQELGDAQAEIVICPSFLALYPVAQVIKKSGVSVGAQTCSSHTNGSYTGQVSATDLQQVGCRYVIVGHSEERATGATDAEIAQKIERVLEADMKPIVCIGEPWDIHQQHTTPEYLEQQILLFKHLSSEIIIAYEPLWAIGTRKLPTVQNLTEIIAWLKNELPNSPLLYGGSVNKETVSDLKKVQGINGFLIGDASLDFNHFNFMLS